MVMYGDVSNTNTPGNQQLGGEQQDVRRGCVRLRSMLSLPIQAQAAFTLLAKNPAYLWQTRARKTKRGLAQRHWGHPVT